MNEQTETGAKHECFCGGAGPRFTAKAHDLRSKATVEHFRKSGAEFLKGIRTILDVGIDYLSRDPNARGTTVNVE